MTTTIGRTGEPRLASIASWAVLTASFGLSASTWIALAILSGFTAEIRIHDLTARLAWLMPVAVDGYLVVALVLWMSPVPTVITSFARKNTYMAAAIGIAAQSAYHALLTWSLTQSTWRTVLAALVGSLPPAFAGLAVHMRALIRRESDPNTTTTNIDTTNTDTIDRQPATTVRADLTSVPSVIDPPAPARLTPSPVAVADRITLRPPTTVRHETAPVPDRSARTQQARPTVRTTSPAALVAPSTDIPVTAQAATPPAPTIVNPDLSARATQVAAQYRIEHGTPITSGQLAVRLKVTSEQAALLLAHIDQAATSPSIRTVNGHPAGVRR